MAVGLILLAIVVVALVVGTIVRRRQGYSVGGDTIVRCRDGHLFTTLWVPGMSFKSVRLGWMRFQYCPVGRHWTTVKLVKDADLTEEERESASQTHDTRIP